MGHAGTVSESSVEWQAWSNGLDARGRAAAESLRARFEALGAVDGGDWAKAEICEHTLMPSLPVAARASAVRRRELRATARPTL